jgi:hypothetical protein
MCARNLSAILAGHRNSCANASARKFMRRRRSVLSSPRTGPGASRTASQTHNARLSNGTSLAAGVRAPALARGVIMRHLSGVLRSLDRYAARCVDLAPVIARIAVPRARSAPKDTGNQPRGVTQISSGAVPCHLQHHSFDRGGRICISLRRCSAISPLNMRFRLGSISNSR